MSTLGDSWRKVFLEWQSTERTVYVKNCKLDHMAVLAAIKYKITVLCRTVE